MSAHTLPLVDRPVDSEFVKLVARILSFPAMLVSGLLFLTFWTCSTRFDDPDLWWHLKLGQTMWSTGQIPSTDQFSFTAHGSYWIAHEWLSQTILYGVYQAGGLVGLQIGFCIVASLIVGLTYLLCSLWSGTWKVALVGGMGALVFLTVSLSIRPLLLGHLFLVLELLLLYAGIAKGRLVWMAALPVLFVIWANSHGSFLFGLALLCATVAGHCFRFEGWKLRRTGTARELKWLGIVVALCMLAPLVNPVGPALAVYPIDVLLFQPDNTGSIQEWAALDLFEPRGMGLVGVLAFVIAMVVAFRRKLTAGEWCALLVTAGMALQHTRMLPIFGFVACPIVCRMLALLGEL